MPKRSGCIFCGGTPLTLEHLFPQWSAAVIDRIKPSPLSSTGQFQLRHFWGGTPSDPKVQWIADSPDLKSKCVCGPCNSGWMSDIETAASPVLTEMIEDRPIVLTTEQQRKVSLWMALKAIVMQHSHDDPPPGPWTGDFGRLREPPESWQIRIGRYIGTDQVAMFSEATLKIQTHHLLSPFALQAPGFLFTVVLGHFAAQVLAVERQSVFQINRRYFVEIWPRGLLRVTNNPGGNHLISSPWPPQLGLDDAQIQKCAVDALEPKQ